MFHIWGASICPCTFGCLLYIWMPPDAPHMFKHLLYVPNAPLCTCMFQGVSAHDGGCRGPSLCLNTPHVSNTPTHLYAPLHVYVLGVIACAMGENPICWWLGGFSTSVKLLVSVSTSLDVHYASSCAFLVVHYVFYFHCYDYYSPGDCCVFWYVISIINDHGFLFDGASYNVESS